MVRTSIIWIIGISLALVSGLIAVGAIAKDKAPQLAVSMRPLNGFAAENLAATPVKSMITENRGQFPQRIDSNLIDLAEQAFITEPITPQAVAVLALGGAENNRGKLMNAALSLSRRQQLITSWMVADSGSREDIPAILNHYDIMVRTSSSAASVIIPVMATALANDDFLAPFASLLEKQPPWENQFWGTVVGTSNSLRNAARLREALYQPDEIIDAYRDPELILGLVNNQQFEEAVSLYHLLVGQKRSGYLLENGSFENESRYQPIDWLLFSTGSYGASITKGNLHLSAIRNAGGVFARQLVEMPASTVKIEVQLGAKIPAETELAIILQCAEKIDNRPQLVRIKLQKLSTFRRINNQGSGCRYYWLDVTGRASENSVGFDVNIDRISLETEMPVK